MVSGSDTSDITDIRTLKEKCPILDRPCAAYLSALEEAVAERTHQIRKLKDRLTAENMVLRQELADAQSYGAIIGQSHPIKTVISQIEMVAPTDASVLIDGESGTGKELVAREIHKRSNRSQYYGSSSL